ncbi:MAG: hypothetical protein KDA47_09075, partial [Planctomycetales bacterium]|nr:hypothetical protein [Planctomycetales bacterium]
VNNDGQVSLDDWNAVWVALGSPDNIAPPTGPVAWNSGVGTLGYDRRIEGNEYSDLIDVNIEDDVYDQNGSVYVRYPFTIADPDALAGLALNVRFDDAFVAYLNGEEIARSGAVGDTDWNTTAAWQSEGGFGEFEIELYAHLLKQGANVLAIQLLNVAADDDDLFLQVALLAGLRAAEGTLAMNATTGSWNLAGGTILGGTIVGSDGQSLLTSDGSFGTLDGVTLATDVAISDSYSLFVRNNLALSDSELTLAHADDVQGWNNVDFGLRGRIVGSGTVLLTTNNLGYYGSLSATELTIDPEVEIRGTGSISTTSLVNRGTIISDVPLAAINVHGETFTNSGTMIARAGSSFYLDTDVVLTSESTLISEIEGTEPDDFGNFGITSDIQFDGTLAIDAINGFTPDVGYSFMPIMMSSGSGSFAAVNGGSLAFSVTIGVSDVTVERTAGLMLFGAGGATSTASEVAAGDLAIIVESAIERWWEEGRLTAEQRTMLQALSFSIVDFGASSQLAVARGGGIVIDNDAAGAGWYVDRTPLADEEFSTIGNRVVANAGSAAVERVDLLSAVMHELAHWLGAEHSDNPADLMFESLAAGERKTAWPEELDGVFQSWQ